MARRRLRATPKNNISIKVSTIPEGCIQYIDNEYFKITFSKKGNNILFQSFVMRKTDYCLNIILFNDVGFPINKWTFNRKAADSYFAFTDLRPRYFVYINCVRKKHYKNPKIIVKKRVEHLEVKRKRMNF